MGVFLLHRVLTKKISTGFEPFGNKILAVEFVQIAHYKYCKHGRL